MNPEEVKEFEEYVETKVGESLRRQRALSLLREWFPDGGTVYVIRRRRTRHGNLIIDAKRIGVERTPINIGVTVADALRRPYQYNYDGFYASQHEMPDLFTRQLSEALYGQVGKLRVEMM